MYDKDWFDCFLNDDLFYYSLSSNNTGNFLMPNEYRRSLNNDYVWSSEDIADTYEYINSFKVNWNKE